MNVETISWNGWDRCCRITNDKIELIVTLDVGPRIISYSLLNQSNNVFAVNQDLAGKIGGNEWVNYGGHRLWHAPEDPARTYQPDNQPVTMTRTEEGGVQFTQEVEPDTGIQKSIYIEDIPDGSTQVDVEHTLTNKGMWEIGLSIWALSVMKSGGIAIIPLPERGKHPDDLLPNTQLVFWSYVDMGDPRWVYGREYLMLKQEKTSNPPLKVGGGIKDGWLAYVNNETTFIKRYGYAENATYPDLGCNVEVFTNAWMLELETLSRIYRLPPGESRVHSETWSLHADIPTPTTDDDVKQYILPLV